MIDIYGQPEQSEKKKYRGEASATEEEKEATGGEKTLQIENVLFQDNNETQAEAEKKLARLKIEKKYFEITSKFCPVPIERRDIVFAEEFITNDLSIWHAGLVRQIKLDITPNSQVLTFVLEEEE